MAGILLRTVHNFVRSTPFSIASMAVPSQQILDQVYPLNYVQNRGAARKGIRLKRNREARARATKRRLLEAQNPKPKKEHKRNLKIDKSQLRLLNEREIDLSLPEPPKDDVYFYEKFKRKKLSFDEIIEMHRQVVHPEVFNVPDALVTATIELNLKMKIKRKKYVEKIESTVCYPHLFTYAVRPRKIVALCKDEALHQACRDAGAILAGGADLTNLLKTNQLTQRDFDHIVCHTDFLVDFAAVKGMKSQPYFPSKSRGNYGDDVVELARYFKNGIDYSLKKNDDEPHYGFIECHFGKLNMTNEQLRENIMCLFESINRFKPLNLVDGKQFFERVYITTPPSQEMFLLKFWDMLEDYQDPETIVEETDEQTKVAAQN